MATIIRRLPYFSRSISTASRTPTPAPPKELFKVQLMRSSIALEPRVRRTVSSLGFKRRMDIVYCKANAINVGKILKIKELVKVETVSKEQMLRETAPVVRSAMSGYTVIDNALRERRLH